jgi:hypothetical protein
MTASLANALYAYFKTLYDLNRNTLMLCSEQIFNHELCFNLINDIVRDIPRLIPYSFNFKANQCQIINGEGLLDFSSELPWLNEEYAHMLQEHQHVLVVIKKIRNKYEHEMHKKIIVSSQAGTAFPFSFTLKVEDDLLNLDVNELKSLLLNLNQVYSRIQNDLARYLYENSMQGDLYYDRLTRFKFNDFNALLSSSLLKIIGNALLDF